MQRVRKHSIVWLAILSLQVIASNVAPAGTNAARLPDILLRGRSLISNTLLPILRSAALHAAVAEVVALTPCDAPANAVVTENCRPGNDPTEWDISGAGDTSIQGFATDISVNRGQTVSFKILTPTTNYRLDIYRMGYYGGKGARKVTTILPSVTPPQPACLTEVATGLIDCGNWAVSASWNVPANATSGIYFAKVVRQDMTPGQPETASHIFFVVRDDDGHSDLLFQTSDTTWQAYNNYGGNSLYVGAPAGRAYKVSYNRPFDNRANSNGPMEGFVFSAEYPMVRWLEANGYDVSYT